MEKIHIDLGKYSYYIYIGYNLIEHFEDCTRTADKFIIITDENVDKLYGKRLQKAMGDRNAFKYVITPGESSKNIDTVTSIISYMINNKLTRDSQVIALGGGVVGDIAGFCASIYMRGINLIQVPTTLLAQVDSSVGGKTGVNMARAKNIIGAFHQPQSVVIDTSVLYSLSSKELLSGLGEVVKYGVIKDYSFFNYIRNNIRKILDIDKETIEYIIKKCCEIKAYIVSNDEKEEGLRKILNFGHTVGHALEAITGYKKYTHGEAVLAGMYYEAILAKEMNLIDRNYFHEITDLIGAAGISLDISRYNQEKLVDFMLHDKKNKGDKISFMLPQGRGKVKEYRLAKHEIKW